MFPLVHNAFRGLKYYLYLAISKNVAKCVLFPVSGTNDTVFTQEYILFEQLLLILLSVTGRVWVEQTDMTAHMAALATFVADQELELNEWVK